MKYKIKRRKTIKISHIFILLVITLISISGAYALWTTTLTINGSVTGTAQVYSITYNNVDNSSNYISQIVSHGNYDVTFTGTVPSSITVTMGGVTLTENTDFTYTNGRLIINTVTGNLVITGASSQQTYYKEFTSQDTTVTYTFDNLSFSDFLALNFTFKNGSSSQIKKLTIELSAIAKKVGSGSGSQYIAPKLVYNNTTTSMTTMAFSANTNAETQVTKSTTLTNKKIPANTDFSIYFTDNGTLSQIIEIVRIVSVKFTVTY